MDWSEPQSRRVGVSALASSLPKHKTCFCLSTKPASGTQSHRSTAPHSQPLLKARLQASLKYLPACDGNKNRDRVAKRAEQRQRFTLSSVDGLGKFSIVKRFPKQKRGSHFSSSRSLGCNKQQHSSYCWACINIVISKFPNSSMADKIKVWWRILQSADARLSSTIIYPLNS